MIDIHADDYALTVRTSEEMLALMRDGVFDSISIITNMSCHDDCIRRLIRDIPDLPFLPSMSVHLNIVEGLSLSKNDGSLITTTWKSLFFASFIPLYRNAVKCRIKDEISAQIEKGWNSIEACIKASEENNVPCGQKSLRIDSHQHTHMIPVVRDALIECLKEKGLKTEYIRNSMEPLAPFFENKNTRKSYRAVNIVKNRLLWFLGRMSCCDRIASDRAMYLWGLIMSGKMDADRVSELYNSVLSKANSDGKDLEVLFHPGRMGTEEMCSEIPESSAVDFYLSKNRDVEKTGARRCRELVGKRN